MKSLGAFDAIVAATGVAYAEPVITNDTDDFGSVEELVVELW
jgi:predicted nucleic acid-binding protein